MIRGWLIMSGVAGLVMQAAAALGQTGPVATFKSAVDLVRVSAIARDHKGHFVDNLAMGDFEVLDDGVPRRIIEFSHESEGISVALLFDVSGSMGSKIADAREAAAHVLAWLDPTRDEVAIYAFDTRLEEVVPFTVGLKDLPSSMSTIRPFGATSLHDAIAETARRSAHRGRRRSAVVVLTDGEDTASQLTAPQVSAIASGIDVPVYIFGIVKGIDNPLEDRIDDPAGPVATDGSARRSRGVHRRPRVHRQRTRAAEPGRAAAGRGASPSVPSSRSNRAANRAGIRSWSARAARTSSCEPVTGIWSGNLARIRSKEGLKHA